MTSRREAWIIPEGAQNLIGEIVAKEIFRKIVQEHAKNNTGVKPWEVRDLLRNYPAICHEAYSFRSSQDGEIREASALAMLCVVRPTVELIELALEANPEAISTPSAYKKSLPLHYACSFGASFEVIKLLTLTYPDSLRHRRVDSILPLHCVCVRNPDPTILRFFLDMAPETAQMVGPELRTPLHLVCCSQVQVIPTEALEMLFEAHPESVSLRAHHGRTPLHCACLRKGGLAAIQFLLRVAPDVLLMSDAHSHVHSPMEYAAREQSLAVIRYMLDTQPHLAPRINPHTGVSLLHHAVVRNTEDVVQYLATSMPALHSSRTLGPTRFTPLGLACYFNAPMENIRVLVSLNPRSLTVREINNKTALDIARQQACSSDLVAYLEEQTAALHG